MLHMRTPTCIEESETKKANQQLKLLKSNIQLDLVSFVPFRRLTPTHTHIRTHTHTYSLIYIE